MKGYYVFYIPLCHKLIVIVNFICNRVYDDVRQN